MSHLLRLNSEEWMWTKASSQHIPSVAENTCNLRVHQCCCSLLTHFIGCCRPVRWELNKSNIGVSTWRLGSVSLCVLSHPYWVTLYILITVLYTVRLLQLVLIVCLECNLPLFLWFTYTLNDLMFSLCTTLSCTKWLWCLFSSIWRVETVHSQYWLLRDYELILVLTTMGPTVGPESSNKSA